MKGKFGDASNATEQSQIHIPLFGGVEPMKVAAGEGSNKSGSFGFGKNQTGLGGVMNKIQEQQAVSLEMMSRFDTMVS